MASMKDSGSEKFTLQMCVARNDDDRFDVEKSNFQSKHLINH